MNASSLRASFALVFCACATVHAGVNFDPKQSIYDPPGSGNFGDVVAGDVDGDGDQDLVTNQVEYDAGLGQSFSTIRVLRSDGGLVFTPTTSFAAGGYATALVLADLDGDGSLDLAMNVQSVVASAVVNELVIADGDGSGGFGPLGRQTVAQRAARLFARDLDADADPDLVAFAVRSGPVAFDRIETVATYTNQSGVFSGAQSIDVALNQRLIALADVDGDGYPDVLVGPPRDSFGWTAFDPARMLHNGAGGFAATTVTVTALPVALDAAVEVDLDGSGALELVTMAFDPHRDLDGEDLNCKLRIHRRAGASLAGATAAATRTVPCGDAPVAAKDIDGDGSIDIVYRIDYREYDYGYVNALSVGANDQPMPSPRVAGDGLRLVADLDGDPRLDLVAATGTEVDVLRGSSAPNRLPLVPPTLSYSISPGGHVLGSFATTDPDGNPFTYDLVGYPQAHNSVLWLDTQNGTFDYSWDTGTPSGTDSFTIRISDHSGTPVDVVIQLDLGTGSSSGGGGGGGGGSLDLLTLALLFAGALGMATRRRRELRSG